jgi:ABC-2 type transport system ATP-binding protein
VTAIEVQGLRKAYEEHEAVRGIDFEVRRGEVFGLLGPNGAGKTTTVEILEGYRSRSAGKVAVLGHDPADRDPDLRARVGIVLQSSGIYRYLTVRESVAHWAGFYPRPRDVEETISIVGLEEAAEQRANKLSGGQQRRLDLALALVGDPELVFLDEPTTGMDPAARRMLWDVVLGLRSAGRTVLLTTHYLEEAEVLCDRVAIMDHGHILEEGTVEELVSRRFKERAVRFEAIEGLPDERLAAMSGVSSVKHEDGEVLVYTADVAGTIGGVLAAADGLGVEPVNLGVRRATLEDVFLDLTGRALRD